jgi:hypothetical protein
MKPRSVSSIGDQAAFDNRQARHAKVGHNRLTRRAMLLGGAGQARRLGAGISAYCASGSCKSSRRL